MPAAFPVCLSLHPSRRLRAAQYFLHLLALAALLLLWLLPETGGHRAWFTPLGLILAVGLLLSLIRSNRQLSWFAPQGQHGPAQLQLYADGAAAWRVSGAAAWQPLAGLTGQSLAGSRWGIFVLTLEFVDGVPQRRYLLLGSDSLTATESRWLSVWLAWARAH